MREFLRNAGHLVRLGILFAAGIVLFLAVRAYFVPPGFGELGHYRTGAIEDNRNLREPVFAGRKACLECHDAVSAGGHEAIGCESCHGALAAHAADPAAVTPAALDVTALCAGCHSAEPARPATHPQVDPESHSEGNVCTECHAAHTPAL